MPLKEVVIETTGDAIRRTKTEVPEYLQRAISESVERGRNDAKRRVIMLDRIRKIRSADSTED